MNSYLVQKVKRMSKFPEETFDEYKFRQSQRLRNIWGGVSTTYVSYNEEPSLTGEITTYDDEMNELCRRMRNLSPNQKEKIKHLLLF